MSDGRVEKSLLLMIALFLFSFALHASEGFTGGRMAWVEISQAKDYFVLVPKAATSEDPQIFRLQRSLRQTGTYDVSASTFDELSEIMIQILHFRQLRIFKTDYNLAKFIDILDSLQNREEQPIPILSLMYWIHHADKTYKENHRPTPLKLKNRDFIRSFFIGLLFSGIYQVYHPSVNLYIYTISAATAWWITKDFLYYKLMVTRRLRLPDGAGPFIAGAAMSAPAICHLIVSALGR